jgi:hypothetical protein
VTCGRLSALERRLTGAHAAFTLASAGGAGCETKRIAIDFITDDFQID